MSIFQVVKCISRAEGASQEIFYIEVNFVSWKQARHYREHWKLEAVWQCGIPYACGRTVMVLLKRLADANLLLPENLAAELKLFGQ